MSRLTQAQRRGAVSVELIDETGFRCEMPFGAYDPGDIARFVVSVLRRPGERRGASDLAERVMVQVVNPDDPMAFPQHGFPVDAGVTGAGVREALERWAS